MEEAEVLCDRVAVVDRGRVIALGSPAGLVASLGRAQPAGAPQSATLEDVFVSLTGRHLRDD